MVGVPCEWTRISRSSGPEAARRGHARSDPPGRRRNTEDREQVWTIARRLFTCRSAAPPILRSVTDSPTTTDRPLPEELVRLASADNFRDVAGPGAGYPTGDGGHVRRGVYYRSNELQLTAEDAASLADLGITMIHDLRGGRRSRPTPTPRSPARPGSTSRFRHPDGDGRGPGRHRRRGPRDAQRVRRVRARREARASYARLLTDLATGDVPQLFHCTAGKDRTGWAAALLLEIAGVDRATIMADYLLTNDVSSRPGRSTSR